MIGNKVCFFQSLESTNSFMKDHLKEYKNGDIVCANAQTAGKGRRSNVWVSSAGDLHISLFFDNAIERQSNFELILLVTNSIINLLNKLNIKAKIKYPNDIVVGNKKIAGILIERVIGESDVFIVGIGLNIVTSDFSNINKNASSILLETKMKYDYRDILFDFIQEYNKLKDCKSCELFEQYLESSVILNRNITIDNEVYHVTNINLDGKLVLFKDGVEHLKHMSEVSFKEFYNE